MKKQNKIKPLDAKFFTNLANRIYDTKTRKYLRLCSGKLTNGPDPENSNRQMHCGLGEAYFAMTGNHTGSLGESNVIDEIMDNLSIKIKNKQDKLNIINMIKSLKNIDKNIKEIAQDTLTLEFDDNVNTDQEQSIHDILINIPNNNDCNKTCDFGEKMYKDRSRRIAKNFRDIAKILSRKNK